MLANAGMHIETPPILLAVMIFMALVLVVALVVALKGRRESDRADIAAWATRQGLTIMSIRYNPFSKAYYIAAVDSKGRVVRATASYGPLAPSTMRIRIDGQ